MIQSTLNKDTKEGMQQNDIDHWLTSLESFHMNSVENDWGAMKYYIRHKTKPRMKKEHVTHVCNKFIDHFFKVVPAVITRRAAASGY